MGSERTDSGHPRETETEREREREVGRDRWVESKVGREEGRKEGRRLSECCSTRKAICGCVSNPPSERRCASDKDTICDLFASASNPSRCRFTRESNRMTSSHSSHFCSIHSLNSHHKRKSACRSFLCVLAPDPQHKRRSRAPIPAGCLHLRMTVSNRSCQLVLLLLLLERQVVHQHIFTREQTALHECLCWRKALTSELTGA